jgi:hypothetical protein
LFRKDFQMNELAKIANPDQIRAELELVLASRHFKKKIKLSEILRDIVEQRLAGKEVTETSIADSAYPKEKFISLENSKVRVAIGEIRMYLAQYNEYEGSADPIHIHLPLGTYTPSFEEQPLLPPKHGPSIQTPSNPPPTGKTRSVFWRRLLSAAGVLAAGCLLWLVYNRPCSASISISDPKTGTAVPRKYVVQTARASEQRFCNCKDYVIVEAVDYGQWYVQGRLPDGPQPSLTAIFGDPDTPSGTPFRLFVLSTKADLPPGSLVRSSPSIEAALQSAPVEVTRK